jgi:hypothetical protein
MKEKKKARFIEEQIVAVLREQEARVSTAEVCRKHGDFLQAKIQGRRQLGPRTRM